ncbi:hypothetical protein K402DRAFT_454406 [Aulographum hederae CBS 113979]|uniref:Apple domain-containing protein n=1 Tax=Aulographum hederae CBS 113979 TaxID=1176131 RepID=A0A6G1GZN2_9PEZI|nr:hypothetical protein K402DRAFT_454406 [Aulographum hederae CBS 113979]
MCNPRVQSSPRSERKLPDVSKTRSNRTEDSLDYCTSIFRLTATTVTSTSTVPDPTITSTISRRNVTITTTTTITISDADDDSGPSNSTAMTILPPRSVFPTLENLHKRANSSEFASATETGFVFLPDEYPCCTNNTRLSSACSCIGATTAVPVTEHVTVGPFATQTFVDVIPGTTTTLTETVTVKSALAYIPPPEPLLLKPIAPFGKDPSSLDLVIPSEQSDLFYAAPPGSEDQDAATIARVSVSFEYPSVALDPPNYITDIVCAEDSISMRYTSATAFKQSQNEWPVKVPLVLITAAPTCSEDGGNAFFVASSFIFDPITRTVIATGSIEKLDEIFSQIDLDWGSVSTDPDAGGPNADTYGCGTPANGTVPEFPEAPCGPQFDGVLDDAIGFYSADENDEQAVLSQLFPGSGGGQARRWGWGWLGAVVKAVVNVVQQVVAVVKAVVVQIGNFILDAVLGFISILRGDYEKSIDIPIDIRPPFQVDTPWGKGSLIWATNTEDEKKGTAKGVAFWCVGCAAVGHFRATGALTVTPWEGISKAELVLNGNMLLSLNLGIQMFAQIEKKKELKLLEVGVPGLSIPGILTIGPMASFGVSAGVTAKAEGKVLVGGVMRWPNIYAKLDVINGQSSSYGLSPIIKRNFKASGKVSVEAAIGLPLTLSVGVSIFNGKWYKGAGFTLEPALSAEVGISPSAALTLGPHDPKVEAGFGDDCYGIAWKVGPKYELKVDIFGLKDFVLAEDQLLLADGCVGWKVEVPESCPEVPPGTVTTPQEPKICTERPEEVARICSPRRNSVCGVQYADNINSSNFIGNAIDADTAADCALYCIKNDACASFGFLLDKDAKARCILYRLGVTEMGYHQKPVASQTMYERVCWEISDCQPKAPATCTNTYGDGQAYDCAPNPYCAFEGATTMDSAGNTWVQRCNLDMGIESGLLTESVSATDPADCMQQAAIRGWQGITMKMAFFGIQCYGTPNPKDFPSVFMPPNMPDCNGGFGFGFGDWNNIFCWFSRSWFSTWVRAGQDPGNFIDELDPTRRSNTSRLLSISPRQEEGEDEGMPDSELDDSLDLSLSTDDATSSSPFKDPSIFTPTHIHSLDGSLALSATDSGNLYLSFLNDTISATPNATFAFDPASNLILGDTSARLLHYFPATKAKFGVSRIRLAEWGRIPLGARLISLAPFEGDDGRTFLQAVDPSGDFAFLAVCGMLGQKNKVFLVSDLRYAQELLERAEVRFTVTGGVVKECSALVVAAVAGGAGTVVVGGEGGQRRGEKRSLAAGGFGVSF